MTNPVPRKMLLGERLGITVPTATTDFLVSSITSAKEDAETGVHKIIDIQKRNIFILMFFIKIKSSENIEQKTNCSYTMNKPSFNLETYYFLDNENGFSIYRNNRVAGIRVALKIMIPNIIKVLTLSIGKIN